jgi:hypothetical protein
MNAEGERKSIGNWICKSNEQKKKADQDDALIEYERQVKMSSDSGIVLKEAELVSQWSVWDLNRQWLKLLSRKSVCKDDYNCRECTISEWEREKERERDWKQMKAEDQRLAGFEVFV